MTDAWLQQQRGHRLISLIYYGQLSSNLLELIADVVQKIGTPNLGVYYPQIHHDYRIQPIYTTPLIAAILRRKDPEPMIRWLIEDLQADPNFTPDPAFGLPLDYAVMRKDDALIHLLRDYGGQSIHPLRSGDAEFLQEVIQLMPGGTGYQEAKSHFLITQTRQTSPTTPAT
jgi:hypothetical protein